MFGLKHIIILVCTVLLIVGILFFTRKWSLQKKSHAFLLIGICSEIVKIFFYIINNEETMGGILPKTDLPFQLCSIQILFIIAVRFTKSEKVRNVLLAFMMPSGLIGGAAAVFIPTSSSLNYWVITFQYYIYHAALISFAISIIMNKERRLTVKDYYSSMLFILGLMFFAIYINSIVYDGETAVNFMYVVSPPVDGLPFLTEKHGWFVYIMHYATLVVVSITACYAKPIYTALKEKFSKKFDEKENS